MQKLSITVVILVASTTLLLANVRAQQTPATGASQPPAAKTQTTLASGAQKAPAAKAGTTTKPKTPAPLVLKTEKDKVSYALGMSMGKDLGSKLKQGSVEVDQAILLRGVKDALSGSKLLLTDDEVKAVFAQLNAEVRKRLEEKARIAGDANKKEGDDSVSVRLRNA